MSEIETLPRPNASSTIDPACRPLGGRTKRAFDVALAILALSSSAIVFVFVAALVYAASPGPVFYAHRRVGFGGRSFPCLKFRTMVRDSDHALRRHLASDAAARAEWARNHKLRDDPRVIPVVGHFLRRTSLDELPQLLNILRGDMSFVGPRPVTDEEIALYGHERSRYQQVRPGITGLWQVSGRSRLMFSDRVALDVLYVQRWSFWGDLAILARTFGVVVRGEGAY